MITCGWRNSLIKVSCKIPHNPQVWLKWQGCTICIHSPPVRLIGLLREEFVTRQLLPQGERKQGYDAEVWSLCPELHFKKWTVWIHSCTCIKLFFISSENVCLVIKRHNSDTQTRQDFLSIQFEYIIDEVHLCRTDQLIRKSMNNKYVYIFYAFEQIDKGWHIIHGLVDT